MMMQIDHINVLGVGTDGKEIVNHLFADYLLTEVFYLHYMELEMSDETYIPFPGTVSYVYGKKHDIYEINQIDRDDLNDIYNKFHSDTIIIMSLAEPISQFILEDLIGSTYKMIIRFPFKFENTRHFERSLHLLKRIEKRPNTIILDTERYTKAVKPVGFGGIKYQLFHSQASYIAALLGSIPEDTESCRYPLNYLCRNRVTFVFDPDDIDFDISTFKKSIDHNLEEIIGESFKQFSINSFTYSRGYFYYIDGECTIDVLSFFLILLYFKELFENEGSYFIWGSDAYDLVDLLFTDELNIPKNLEVLLKGFEYLKKRFNDTKEEQKVFKSLTNLWSQYIVEIKTSYLNKSFLQSLSIK
ncbi:hypothetical protein [Sphingobacterium lactis]|uniref:hypothetical protein n=1 Tax=Sphingobacterium lactis TaxID=797291 RepID=UPI003DA52C19